MIPFFLRKLAASLLYPPTFCLLLVLLGCGLLLCWRTRRLGTWIAFAGGIFLLLLSIPAFQEPFLRMAESPPPPGQPTDAVAIVVLGSGAFEWEDPVPPTAMLTATSMARTIEGVRLAREFPHIQLIFTGGKVGERMASSEAMAALAVSLGIPKERILTFSEPTSTAEEARRTADELGPAPILLVTSALHMPRSETLFAEEGLTPHPCPTDYLSSQHPPDALDYLPTAGAWLNWQRLFHEIYGRLWARL